MSRWAQLCRTAPSICRGQPTGICDCSRSPSPFCSIIVPSIGTSIVAFKLICARLQLHASGAKTSFGQFCWCWEFRLLFKGQSFLFDDKLEAVHWFRLCRFPGSYYVLKPGRANRLDPYCAGGVSIFDAFPVQAVVYGGNHPCGDKYGDELNVPCYL